MIKKYFAPYYIALTLALLFHICGAAGILLSDYKEWFISSSPITVLLMSVLIIFTQKEKNTNFIVFAMLCFMIGLLTEMIGVNTGYLFGNYEYGNVLGPKIFGVPWLIGINWFVVIYCAGCTTHIVEAWILKQTGAEIMLSTRMQHLSFIIDTALLAVFFDWLIEPVAIKLGYWSWLENDIPFYNYVCWFLISLILSSAMRFLSFNKANLFAVHLFIIQGLFFLLLRTFL